MAPVAPERCLDPLVATSGISGGGFGASAGLGGICDPARGVTAGLIGRSGTTPGLWPPPVLGTLPGLWPRLPVVDRQRWTRHAASQSRSTRRARTQAQKCRQTPVILPLCPQIVSCGLPNSSAVKRDALRPTRGRESRAPSPPPPAPPPPPTPALPPLLLPALPGLAVAVEALLGAGVIALSCDRDVGAGWAEVGFSSEVWPTPPKRSSSSVGVPSRVPLSISAPSVPAALPLLWFPARSRPSRGATPTACWAGRLRFQCHRSR